jgi:hypothetical protein
MPKLRKSGAIPVITLYTVMVETGTTLLFTETGSFTKQYTEENIGV